MNNIPNSVSKNEVDAWRQWVKQIGTNEKKPIPSSVIKKPQLTQAPWEPILQPGYKHCNSCRRFR